ncbi:MAG: hypothetical protein E7219_07210 [Clostridiales bacterium]|nr:hypothetical protein [Clostridiales bacterium]
MEDNKYYDNGFQKLELDDLGSVAGGISVEQLTDEERTRAYELDAKWKKAMKDCDARRISVAEYEAILFEYHDYIRTLVKKYNGEDN